MSNPSNKDRAAVRLGKRGGAKGGAAWTAALSPLVRRALGRAALQVRYAHKRGEQVYEDAALLARVGKVRRDLAAMSETLAELEAQLAAAILGEEPAPTPPPETVFVLTQTTTVRAQAAPAAPREAAPGGRTALRALRSRHPDATAGELAEHLYGRSDPTTRSLVRRLLVESDE